MVNHNVQITSCPHCGSKNLYSLTGDDEPTRHYGKLGCEDCQKFIKWLANPKVTEECENRRQLINQTLDAERVTGWEAFFFREIRDRRTLSPKQLQKYNQICSRHNLMVKK
jgi:hypothetical protein